MAANFDELASRIRAQFSELSPQFQAGAAFLLDHPDEVATSSMRKVAERAGVQPASLVRLSQQLGFPGWNELRDLFVARVRTRPEPLSSRARSLVAGSAKDALARDLLVAQLDLVLGRVAAQTEAKQVQHAMGARPGGRGLLGHTQADATGDRHAIQRGAEPGAVGSIRFGRTRRQGRERATRVAGGDA